MFRVGDFSLFMPVHQAAVWRPRDQRREGKFPLLNDSGSNLFRDLLPIAACERQLGFGRIGEKTAFDEDSRESTLAKHVIFGGPDPAILSADASNKLPLNARSQHCAAIIFGIGFNAMRAAARRRIIMNANENCVAL